MSSESYTIVRKQILRKGGSTPEFIDDSIPTEPITVRFGPGVGTSTENRGSAWLMGTYRFLGSPLDILYQMTRLRIISGTPNIHFALTHSRRPGTFDIPYLPARGDDLTVGDLMTPIHSILPGTFRVYALGAGGTTSPGKGSPIRYRGFGSRIASGQAGVGFSADFYPV